MTEQLQSELLLAQARIKELESERSNNHDSKFQNVIDASPVPYALNDESQNITYLNPAFINTFGYDLNDIPTLSDWWPKAYPDEEYRNWVATKWQQHLDEAKKMGADFQPIEIDIVCKDGSVRTVLASAASLSESYIGNHLVILYDISERKKIAQERDAEINQLVEALPIGLALCDLEGNLVQVNQAYADIIGCTIEETLKLTYWEITPESYSEKEQQQLDKLHAVGRYGPYVKEYIHKNGNTVPVQLSGVLIRRGEEALIWSVVEDITGRLKKESELLRTQKMEALGKLTGGIAHDFNNMLSVILGFSELLSDEINKTETKQIKYCDEIHVAAERARKLTSKLLDFSRDTPSVTEVVDIKEVVQGMRHLLEKTLTHRISLDIHFGDNLWLIELDKEAFVDAVVNICINSMYAMPKGGAININVTNKKIPYTDEETVSGEFIEIKIEDTGEGIDEDVQKRIFEPFFTTKGKAGTGLGLSQVYGFVKRSGGHINLTSKKNEGTTLYMSFPRFHGEKAEVALEVGERENKTKPGDEIILLVDDEIYLLDLMEEILSSNGYKVLRADNAEKALELLKSTSVDLMISDVIMPGMDGYQLSTEVEKLYPEIKIQIVSGFSDRYSESLENEKLHENRIMKPFETSQLLGRVRELLDIN